MKDLHKSWDAWQQEDASFQLNEAFLEEALKKESADPLIKLRKNIGIKLLWIAGFSLLFLTLIITTDKIYNRILISPLLLAYVVGLALIYGQYRILGFVDKSQNMKYILESYYHRIRRIQQYELKVALFLYPISITAGFVCGFTIEKSAEEILSNSKVWLTLVATNIVLIPACYYLAQYLDRKAYGQYLDRLEEDIKQLEVA
jgi:glucose-6-phosphate-specific signal transduction histidine kinase